MKLRELTNLPVFNRETAEVIGRVEKAVVDDDFSLSYIVVNIPGEELKMIYRSDFEIGNHALAINDTGGIKSYAHGEELSVYNLKVGDRVFDYNGRELGTLNDFVLGRDGITVQGLEISSGVITDLLEGRIEIPLEDVCWKSIKSAMLMDERDEWI